MATPTARDQLLAGVEFAEERLHGMEDTIAHQAEESRGALKDQCATIQARCSALADQIREWPELRLGTATAVEDLSSAVDTLEADVEAAEEAERDRYRTAVDRQLRAWRGRAEHLQLQATLGGMEARDDLEGVAHRLSEARVGVLAELRNVAGDARDAVVDLRDNIEEVLVDVRHAVESAADALVDRKS